MTREKAFVSDWTFSVGEDSYQGVFTAMHLDLPPHGSFRIQIDPLGYTADGKPVSVSIDEGDIRAIRELLGLPDFASHYEACALAIEALTDIAESNTQAPSTVEEWDTLARAMVDTARTALAKIAHLECFYATAADGA